MSALWSLTGVKRTCQQRTNVANDPKRTSSTPSRIWFEPIRCHLLSLGGEHERRQFLGVVGAVVAIPLAARAQQMRHIGVLVVSAKDDPDTAARLAGLRQGLERLGWFEGRNIRIDYRYAAGRRISFRRSRRSWWR